MAKNLKTRIKNFFEKMNQEESKEPVNIPDADHTLTDLHNADMGIPENAKVEVEPQSEEERWMNEATEWKDKYLRLAAEFDNFRKRSMRERSELVVSASSDMIKEMLTILDDFDRAIKANESVEDIEVIKEGFALIHQKLYNKLESKGLKPLESLGKDFDTDFHEAITQIPAPTVDLVGKVVNEVEKGYILNDKVIRFSKVIIGQ